MVTAFATCPVNKKNMAQLVPTEDQCTKIVSTKVTARQMLQLQEFCERKGFGSLYEWMQLISFVTLKFDDAWHGCPQANEEQINDFLRPFLEIEDPLQYIFSCKKDYGLRAQLKGKGEITDVIVVRQGCYISRFRKDGDKLKVNHSVDEAALLVATAGRPDLRGILREAMQANRTASFLELLRILINDALPDIAVMRRNNQNNYVAVQYGNVPKKTHTGAFEYSCVNPFHKNKHLRMNNEDDSE